MYHLFKRQNQFIIFFLYYCNFNYIYTKFRLTFIKIYTMNQKRKLVFSLGLLGTMTFSGCALNQMVKSAKDQELTVTPSPLELHGDSVNFEMSAVLPAKLLKKGKVYTVKPSYQYADGAQELPLEGVEFAAEDYADSDTQPTESQNFSFAYDPAMNEGGLMVEGIASNPKNGKTKSTDKMQVAEGIITTSRMVQDVNYAAYAAHGYNDQEELVPTNVEFFFPQGSSALRTSERRSDRGDFLDAFIAEKNATRTVSITGTHSPEGAERVNTRLAQDRAEAIEKFYRSNMDRYDYQGAADSIEFVTKPVVEDWTMFKEMLEGYEEIEQDQKSQILAIVNGSGSFEEKEDALQQLPSYRAIFRDIYPELRVAKTEILTVMEKKPNSEIAVLSRQVAEGTVSADTLSDEELAFAATLTPSLTEKENIYKAATKKNDSWASHNNLGAVYVEMALNATDDAEKNRYMEMALTQFELSNRKQENAEAYTNLAVVHMAQGNREGAMEAIGQAAELDPSEETGRGIAGIRGALLIRDGNYDEAISTLAQAEESPVNAYNIGLAQLLNKDYQNAMSTLNEVVTNEEEGIHAKAHYLLAVTAARMQNEEQVVTNLEKAVSADPSLKEAALGDLEFDNYADSESFRNSLM